MFRNKKSEAIRKNWLFCSKSCQSKFNNIKRTLPKIEKKCLYCKKNFIVRNKRERAYLFCSRKCAVTFTNKREDLKEKRIKKISGSNNYAWKGDRVGYFGLHCWLRKTYGTPKYCDMCKSITEKKYVWANISGKYKRDRDDFLRLCDKCHKKYDDVLNRSWKTRKI